MPITLGDTRDRLLAGDPELQHLAQQHSQYEAQLLQLFRSPYRNAEDIILEADLKKMKLQVKDAMEKRVAHLSRVVQVH
jgi:hypothetical protein